MLYLPSLVIGTVSTDIFADCNKKASLKKYLLGRNNNTKIHAAVDKQCRPIKLLLSAGNVNDIKVAPLLLDGLVLTDAVVMADKAYLIESNIKNVTCRTFFSTAKGES